MKGVRPAGSITAFLQVPTALRAFIDMVCARNRQADAPSRIPFEP